MAGKRARPGETRLGWIGAGVMGAPMCGHLLDVGFEVTVHSRTRSRADSLLERGAAWAATPRATAEAADVTFVMVGFPADVRQVVLREETGVLGGCAAGDVIVDMSTSAPSLAVEIAAEASKSDVHSVDAPVSGGDVGAREGRLSIMIGGDADVVEALRPCWEAMGQTTIHQGGPGAGQHTKAVNQTLVAAGMVGVCEALLYADRAGLDLDTVLESVASGAAGSWALSNLGPRIIAGDFEPGFYVEHFVKDMGIILDEANRMNLAMPGLAMARQLYTSLMAHGRGRAGTQALILALAELSAVEWPATGTAE